MFKAKSIMGFLIVFVGVFVWVSLESKSSSDDLVPFAVGKAGATASIEVHVSWLTRSFPRVVTLMINVQKSENSLQKLNQLMESTTGLIAVPSPGENAIPKQHAGIPLHVTWVEKKTGRDLKERDVVAQDFHGRVRVGFGEPFGLDWMLLPPGDYVVTVTAVNDDLRFDGSILAGLCVGYLWK